MSDYKRKTNGSIYELNKLSVEELEKELNAMTREELVLTCEKAIWASCMLDEHIQEIKDERT